FQASSFLGFVTRGDALRACPWLSYSAPLALSIDRNPLKARGEEFLFGVNCDDVGAEGADATVGAKGDFGHEASVVLVESFESRDETFAAEIFAAELERMDQDLGRSHCRSLRGRVRGLQFVPLQQAAVFSSTSRGNVGGNGREREKDLVFCFDCHGVGDVSSNKCAEHVNERRPTSSLRV